MLPVCIILLALVSTLIAESPLPHCSGIDCAYLDPQHCVDQSLAYVPSDGVTQCCAECRKVEEIVDTSGCDPSICPRVSCMAHTYHNCFHNQVLAPYDGLCFCCNGCAYKKGSMKCGPKNCEINPCQYGVAPEECISKKLAFVPRDGDCNCCDSCQEVNDVTEPIGCAPEICMPATCTPQTIRDCNGRQVLVPAGGCYCCDTCVDKKLQ